MRYSFYPEGVVVLVNGSPVSGIDENATIEVDGRGVTIRMQSECADVKALSAMAREGCVAVIEIYDHDGRLWAKGENMRPIRLASNPNVFRFESAEVTIRMQSEGAGIKAPSAIASNPCRLEVEEADDRLIR